MTAGDCVEIGVIIILFEDVRSERTLAYSRMAQLPPRSASLLGSCVARIGHSISIFADYEFTHSSESFSFHGHTAFFPWPEEESS